MIYSHWRTNSRLPIILRQQSRSAELPFLNPKKLITPTAFRFPSPTGCLPCLTCHCLIY